LCLVTDTLYPKVEDLCVLDFEHSCHFPLLVKFNQSTEIRTRSNYNTIAWDTKAATIFQDSIVSSISENCNANLGFMDITQIIYNAANVANMVKVKTLGHQNFSGPSWFDSECRIAKRNVKSCIRKYRRECNPNSSQLLGREFNNAKAAYKVLIKEKKVAFYQKIQNSLKNSKNSGEFFRALGIFRNSRGGKEIQEKVKLSAFKEFYENVFSETSNRQTMHPSHQVEDTLLDKDFTIRELEYSIRSMSKNKSPGSDGIPNEVWRNLPSDGKTKLLDCINNIYHTQEIPSDWSKIIIVPIYKKSDASNPANYRPISLVNTAMKLFTHLLSCRLDQWGEKNGLISKYQAAYQKGMGCEMQAFVLRSVINSNIIKGYKKVYALFVDCSLAFDSIRHELLWEKLKKVGLSSKYIGILRAIYEKAEAKVRTQFGFSESFKIKRGVLQGETLSGKLFTIFIDDMIKKLEASGIPPLQLGTADINALLYADDVCLLASNAIHLQEKIEILREYFLANNLKVNLSKTNVVIFRKSGKIKNIPLFYWGNEKVEVVEEYKYLGVPFHGKISSGDEKTAKFFIAKAKAAEDGLIQLFYSSKMRTFANRIALFNSLVQSVLMYCSPVWGLKHCSLLENFQSNFFKRILQLPKYCPRWYVRLETNAIPMQFYFLKAVVKFLIRIKNQPNDSLSSVALHEMIKLHNNPKKDRSLNWFSSIVALCKEHDVHNILNIESILEQDVPQIYDKLNHALSNIVNKQTETDITFLRNSKEFSEYSKLKTHIKTEDYLNSDVPWCICTLLCQLRLNYNYIRVKNMTNSLLAKRFSSQNSIACKLCGLGNEDSYHIMCECPHYVSVRRNFLDISKFNVRKINRENFVSIFNNYDIKVMKNIFMYWCESMKIREVYLNEIESISD
jgi:hypothetical protein